MEWRVYLAGEKRDLVRLSEEIPEGHLIVALDNETEAFYLKAEAFEALTKADDVRQAAEPQIVILNGISSLLAPNAGQIKFAGSISRVGIRQVYVEDTMTMVDAVERSSTVFVTGAFSFTGSASGIAPGAVPQPRTTATAMRLRQMVTHPVLAEVYRVLGSVAKPKWVEFYKVYELLRDAAGGSDKDLSQRTGVSQAQLHKLTMSANHPALSGSDARHAVMKGVPRADGSLTIDDGRAMIDELIRGFTR